MVENMLLQIKHFQPYLKESVKKEEKKAEKEKEV